MSAQASVCAGLEELPDAPRPALDLLRECSLSPEWIVGLSRRRLGQIGIEEELCRRGRKHFGSVVSLEVVAKKCGIKGWDLDRVSGPRALVVGFHLARELQRKGVRGDLAVRAGEVVAGMHGRSPTVGGWRSVADRVVVSSGPLLQVDPVVAPASASVSTLDRGGALLAFPNVAEDEDRAVFGFPFERQERAEAAVRLSSATFQVHFGQHGDVLSFTSAGEAIDAVRHWMDWSQEYGSVHPDRLWVDDSGTVQQLADVFSACFTADGQGRFQQIVLASEGRLLPWSGTVDAVGLEQVD